MVEPVVSFLVNKLGDLLIEEVKFLRGVSDQIELIKIQLNAMKCFLHDADSKRKTDEQVKGWVKDVRNVSCEIENEIDTFLVEMHRTAGKHLSRAERLIYKPAKLLARHKLGEKLTLIKKKIDEIATSRSAYGIKNLGEDGGEERPPFRRPVLPDVDDVEIVGFEVEKTSIVDALFNGSSTQNRRIISIVGPGGLGKTTLAKKIYNDGEVKSQFELRIWLSISQNFKHIDILKRIYAEAIGVELKEVEADEEYLLGKINKSLRKKKYLIILDDVWDEKDFHFLEAGFPDIKNGSRVLITTRIGNVAKCATLNDEYQLPYLNKEESLLLLLKKAFRNCDSSVHCPDILMGLAEQLAERCHGLPLALAVLGDLLSKRPPTYAEWSRVAQKTNWHIDGKECMDILALSYSELPYNLKPCFRYLANFPEDFAISAKSLTRMWIAEGLIANKRGVMEDDADACLEELAQRSLIQVHSRSLNGQIKEIMVHDLLRDLAIEEAQECDFLLICKEGGSLSGNLEAPRRLVLPGDTVELPDMLENINKRNLRSLIQFGGDPPSGLGFLLLRVLQLKGEFGCIELPNELKNMIHLRYLGLKNVVNIPETIGRLQNLQTLDARGTLIESVPDSLWNVPALRHVRVTYKNTDGPPASANLVNLQTLTQCLLPMSWKRGLPHLPHLRRFGIRLCRNNVQENEYEDCEWALRWQSVTNLLRNLNDLVSLGMRGHHLPAVVFDASTSPSYQNLQSLKLHGCKSSRLSLGDVQMPPNLIKLRLVGFHFEQDPMPTLEKLGCLQYLCIDEIKGVSKMVCSAKGFPQLKTLGISEVYNLKEWNVEKEAMPMLQSLSIEECDVLRVLPDLQHVNLKELAICGLHVEACRGFRYKLNGKNF